MTPDNPAAELLVNFMESRRRHKGTDTVHSLTTANAFTLTSGELSVVTTTQVNNSFMLNCGTLTLDAALTMINVMLKWRIPLVVHRLFSGGRNCVMNTLSGVQEEARQLVERLSDTATWDDLMEEIVKRSNGAPRKRDVKQLAHSVIQGGHVVDFLPQMKHGLNTDQDRRQGIGKQEEAADGNAGL